MDALEMSFLLDLVAGSTWMLSLVGLAVKGDLSGEGVSITKGNGDNKKGQEIECGL